MANVAAKIIILSAFAFVVAVMLTACGSRQPPGGDMWVGVQHFEGKRQ